MLFESLYPIQTVFIKWNLLYFGPWCIASLHGGVLRTVQCFAVLCTEAKFNMPHFGSFRILTHYTFIKNLFCSGKSRLQQGPMHQFAVPRR